MASLTQFQGKVTAYEENLIHKQAEVDKVLADLEDAKKRLENAKTACTEFEKEQTATLKAAKKAEHKHDHEAKPAK